VHGGSKQVTDSSSFNRCRQRAALEPATPLLHQPEELNF
jgi:hypothetical protein